MADLLLVRHASAGRRGSGRDDLERPLDARGVAQAAQLADRLLPILAGTASGKASEKDSEKDSGAVVILSSPALRCRATVEPLAARLGVPVTIDADLVEGVAVDALLMRIGAGIDRPTVWSSHGDVIPEMLATLARRGLDLGPDPRVRKASTWVLQVERGTVRTARHLPPPT